MYQEIAGVYHLIYEDWDEAMARQAGALDGVIRDALGEPPFSLLDVTCGIGTQSLGLAAMGYRVVGSDLSTGAINRARMEADTRGLDIAFSVADMRDCGTHHEHGFDVVLSGDNSVPHLERPDDISRTLAGMRERLRPGGLAVIGIRDYKAEDERSVGQVFTYGTRNHGEDRYVVFQTRDWHGDAYDVGMYFVREETDSAPSHVISGRSRFYAITVDAMMALMQSAGFSDVRRIDNASHNVLVTGHRA